MKVFIVLFLAVISIAVAAQITIPVPVFNIPITGQSLAVLVVACLLGKQLGGLTVLVYLVLGTLGLPIFADAASGWEKIVGNSGGFLLGFIIATFVVGYLAEQAWNKTVLKCLGAMTIGTVLIVACGVVRLSWTFGFAKALEYGFYPFLWGAIIKVGLGAVVMYYGSEWALERLAFVR